MHDVRVDHWIRGRVHIKLTVGYRRVQVLVETLFGGSYIGLVESGEVLSIVGVARERTTETLLPTAGDCRRCHSIPSAPHHVERLFQILGLQEGGYRRGRCHEGRQQLTAIGSFERVYINPLI